MKLTLILENHSLFSCRVLRYCGYLVTVTTMAMIPTVALRILHSKQYIAASSSSIWKGTKALQNDPRNVHYNNIKRTLCPDIFIHVKVGLLYQTGLIHMLQLCTSSLSWNTWTHLYFHAIWYTESASAMAASAGRLWSCASDPYPPAPRDSNIQLQ